MFQVLLHVNNGFKINGQTAHAAPAATLLLLLHALIMLL
jgi:hypothetical protein